MMEKLIKQVVKEGCLVAWVPDRDWVAIGYPGDYWNHASVDIFGPLVADEIWDAAGKAGIAVELDEEGIFPHMEK